MANLKADLDSYLNGSASKASPSATSLGNLAKSFNLPTFKSPFSAAAKNGENADDLEVLIEKPPQEGAGVQNRCEKWLDSVLPSLTKKQRIFGFMTSLGLGLFCFSFSTVYIPFLLLKARKFALLFSMGSLFTMSGFSFLWGPYSHFKHLISRERLPFTFTYTLTLTLTLYFAMGLQNYILTVMAAVCQVLALLWFVVSYIPGGQTGLRFFSRICTSLFSRTARSSLPI